MLPYVSPVASRIFTDMDQFGPRKKQACSSSSSALTANHQDGRSCTFHPGQIHQSQLTSWWGYTIKAARSAVKHPAEVEPWQEKQALDMGDEEFETCWVIVPLVKGWI